MEISIHMVNNADLRNIDVFFDGLLIWFRGYMYTSSGIALMNTKTQVLRDLNYIMRCLSDKTVSSVSSYLSLKLSEY